MDGAVNLRLSVLPELFAQELAAGQILPDHRAALQHRVAVGGAVFGNGRGAGVQIGERLMATAAGHMGVAAEEQAVFADGYIFDLQAGGLAVYDCAAAETRVLPIG